MSGEPEDGLKGRHLRCKNRAEEPLETKKKITPKLLALTKTALSGEGHGQILKGTGRNRGTRLLEKTSHHLRCVLFSSLWLLPCGPPLVSDAVCREPWLPSRN